MIKSKGNIPQSENSKSAYIDADINIYQSSEKGKKPTFVLQAGSWHPEIAEVKNKRNEITTFKEPAYFERTGNLKVIDPNTEQMVEIVQYNPSDLPEPVKGKNPSEKLISQLNQYALNLLKATYPNVKFSII